jgi:hypothetical protein
VIKSAVFRLLAAGYALIKPGVDFAIVGSGPLQGRRLKLTTFPPIRTYRQVGALYL